MILPAIFLPSPVDSWFIGTDFRKSDTSSGRVTRRVAHNSKDLSISRKSFNAKVGRWNFSDWENCCELKWSRKLQAFINFSKKLKKFPSAEIKRSNFSPALSFDFCITCHHPRTFDKFNPLEVMMKTLWGSGIMDVNPFSAKCWEKKSQNPCWTHKDD